MEENGHRGVRLVVAGSVLILIIFVLIRLFYTDSKVDPQIAVSSKTVIFALWGVIILFALTFLFILMRNIVKLFFEKKSHQTGARFKNRLIFFFIAFTIVPSFFLYFLATELNDRGIERLFSSDIDSIMSKMKGLEQSYYAKAQEDLKHISAQLAAKYKEKRMHIPENKQYLINTATADMSMFALDVVNIFWGDKEIVTQFTSEIPLSYYRDLTQNFLFQGLSGGDNLSLDNLPNGQLIRCGVVYTTKENQRVLVITGKFYPDRYIKDLRTLSTQVNQYEHLKTIKDPVKTSYTLFFLFLVILIVFAASWMGFYLARGITSPIAKLVDAASEITKGNLNVQIEHKGRDEFSTLIEEFNRMAHDLRDNRDKLNRRTVELRQRRVITENILKNITSGVIALNSRGELVDLNPETERMLGIKSERVLREHYSKVFSEEPYNEIHALIERAYKAKFKLIEKEIDVKLKGKIMNLAAKITQNRNPINNKFSGLLVVLTDLSDLIRAQRTLVWREVAKRIAHEIKNPLTPIQISSQRILKALEQPEDVFRKITEDSLNVILEEIASIKNLADEFANFARMPELKFSGADLNGIVEKLVSVYASIYQEVDFKVDLDLDMPMMIRMDPDQIKRILVNIIDNGIEAMNKTGELEILTRYNRESQFAGIEIADKGPGISDEDKQKLFLPYFSTKNTGTGLGLAIAHNIIEEHNGQIKIFDNDPTGARFVIEIPG
jgi:two-component system nitrogen regulation sensor histidine kinase NtrY